jgi:hypothetical protein
MEASIDEFSNARAVPPADHAAMTDCRWPQLLDSVRTISLSVEAPD